MSPRKVRGTTKPLSYLPDARKFLDSDPPGFIKKRVNYTDGFGLFADRDFSAGSFLLNYRGKTDDDDAPSDPYVYQYMWDTGKRTSCIDARDEDSGIARYINDKDPHHPVNCKASVTEFDGPPKSSTISFIATTDIKKGESFILILCV